MSQKLGFSFELFFLSLHKNTNLADERHESAIRFSVSRDYVALSYNFHGKSRKYLIIKLTKSAPPWKSIKSSRFVVPRESFCIKLDFLLLIFAIRHRKNVSLMLENQQSKLLFVGTFQLFSAWVFRWKTNLCKSRSPTWLKGTSTGKISLIIIN